MATTTLMSFADFERLDFGADQLELLKGELIRLPPPYKKHTEIAEALYRRLFESVERLREKIVAGKVHMEMGYLCVPNPHSWLRPDVSISCPEQTFENYYVGAPLI